MMAARSFAEAVVGGLAAGAVVTLLRRARPSRTLSTTDREAIRRLENDAGARAKYLYPNLPDGIRRGHSDCIRRGEACRHRNCPENAKQPEMYDEDVLSPRWSPEAFEEVRSA